MIAEEHRSRAVERIDEALLAGARLFKACEKLQIGKQTYFRWKSGKLTDKRKGAPKTVPRKLSREEENYIIKTCVSTEYRDFTPTEIYMLELDKGVYIASPSTIYRVLRKQNLVHHRGNGKPAQKRAVPPERCATGPNQVWAWDITYLKADVKGTYFYLYSVIDVWSRKLVGWTISDSESADVSKELFQRLIPTLKIQAPLYLHSDNGNAMKAETLLSTLYRLGVIPSRSRPRVSDDNAFIESFFKTLKYAPGYPGYFKSIEQAWTWVEAFVTWYNTKHLHSGIAYVTPDQKHSLLADQIIAQRNEVKQRAYKDHSYRWSRPLSRLTTPQLVYLNPSKETREKLASGS